MLLVFFFGALLVIIFILFILISLSTLRVTVTKFQVTNFNKKESDAKIRANFCINIGLFLFGKIKIFKSKITDKKLKKINKKLNIKDKIKKIDFKNLKGNIYLDKNTKKKQSGKIGKKKYKKDDSFSNDEKMEMDYKIIEITKFKLNMQIGLEDVIFTSIIINIISIILSILLARTLDKEGIKKSTYKIQPIYYNKNLINVKLESIINIKIVHIMYIIFILLKNGKIKKRRVDNCGRASNRGVNDYSYE